MFAVVVVHGDPWLILKSRNTLETIRWIVTGFDFKEYHISNTEISADKIMLEFLQSTLAPPQLAVVMSMIDTLRKHDKQDLAMRVFTG
ncbi:hypothetical protein FRC06_006437 [Ceratobasidium sp. 370]|nr:hypothetical protein FRC06_006437 [Ceratobasidium sp. 370]